MHRGSLPTDRSFKKTDNHRDQQLTSRQASHKRRRPRGKGSRTPLTFSEARKRESELQRGRAQPEAHVGRPAPRGVQSTVTARLEGAAPQRPQHPSSPRDSSEEPRAWGQPAGNTRTARLLQRMRKPNEPQVQVSPRAVTAPEGLGDPRPPSDTVTHSKNELTPQVNPTVTTE